MLGIFFANVFYSKVMHNKGKGGGVSLMVEETGCVIGWMIAMGCKVFDEVSVGDNTSLGQSIHAFSHFHKDMFVVDEWFQIVLIHDAFWDIFHWYAHVLEMVHWHVYVKILGVGGHESCMGGGDDAVDEEFDSCQVCCWCAHFSLVVNLVTANGEADASGFGLVGAVVSIDLEVSCFWPLGILVGWMKWMVVVPMGMCGWMPSTSLPILLAAELIHFLVLGPSFICVYSRDAPVVGSKMVWMVQ
jgi:hypothetical protein